MNTRVATQSKEEQPSSQAPAGIKTPSQDGPGRYYVEVLGKALDVLDVLRSSRTELRLTDIAEKANLDISTTFRLLRTLEGRGYVLRDNRTKRFKDLMGYRAYRIGYAQLSGDQHFSSKVTQSLMDAAAKSHVELLVTDNRNSPEEAVKNAAWLIAQRVDFVIEYDFHYRVGPVLANMFSKREYGLWRSIFPWPAPSTSGSITMPRALWVAMLWQGSLKRIGAGAWTAPCCWSCLKPDLFLMRASLAPSME